MTLEEQIASLKNRIFEITRGSLDSPQNVRFAFPQIEPLISRLTMVRINRLSRFWKQREDEGHVSLEQSVEDLMAGLYGQSCPWMFLLKGSPEEVECWFGVSREVGESSLRSILLGAYPDVRFDHAGPFDKSCFNRLNHALALTGVPDLKADQTRSGRADRIEKICRGLSGPGAHWLYAVYARPVPAPEIRGSFNDVSRKISDLQDKYFHKDRYSQERFAEEYLNLLEAQLRRIERGRAVGMWESHCVLLANSASLSARAQGLLHSAFSGDKSLPEPIRARPCRAETHPGSPNESPLTRLTSTEAAILACPPREEYPGYEVVEYARFGVEASGSRLQASESISVGDILDRGMNTGNSLRIPLRDLTKHGLIVGVTGSGKTNTCFQLLKQVWQRGVPFLVIESAKSEYRELLSDPVFRDHKDKGKRLKIFTVGDETVSPLRLNPFEVPKGILVQTHIDYLKSLFSAAFVLYPPMPYVLEQSIQEVYEDRGWDLTRDRNDRGEDSERLYPTLSDLAAKIRVVVDRMGYDKQITMDVKAGLLARINQLRLGGGKGPMLRSRRSIPPSALFESPCILELKQIVSDDEKAFIIGLILIRLYEYYEGRSSSNPAPLSHITLIEEAHRLLRNVSTEQGSEVVANPKGRAIEVFSNILSEIRAYGEGIFLAEQIPVKLAPDAIKNTNLKIIHRLVAEDDRRAVGSTVNLSESQVRYLTTLKTGEGVAFTEGMQKPVLVSVPCCATKDPHRQKQVSPQSIRTAMDESFWSEDENRCLKLPFPACARCSPEMIGKGCAGLESGHASAPLLSSCKRLFNALRLNHDLVLEAYLEFNRLSQSSPVSGKGGNSTYCAFVGLVEAEVERRGEFSHWPYDQVAEAIRLACSVAYKLTRKESREMVQRDLTALSAVFDGLHSTDGIDVLPYAGCQACTKPCHYRFDMTHPSHDASVKESFSDAFRSAVFSHREAGDKAAELARVCWSITEKTFPLKDAGSRAGAALCFAVQQLNALELSPDNQEKWSAKIRECLYRPPVPARTESPAEAESR